MLDKNKLTINIKLYRNIFDEKVRWGDTDGYNHVNNVSISRDFESARVNIIRNLETEKYSFVLVSNLFNISQHPQSLSCQGPPSWRYMQLALRRYALTTAYCISGICPRRHLLMGQVVQSSRLVFLQ